MKLTNTYRKLVKDTTINDKTLLSTDYLNHYNELVMMLEMIPDMPEMLDDAVAWEPKTYQEHFRDSVFQHKDLAVMAYENAPEEYRRPMDLQIAEIDTRIEAGLPKLVQLAESGESALLTNESTDLTYDLRAKLEKLSAIINGAEVVEEVERASEEAGEEGGPTMGQDDIDALFN